MRPRRAQDHYIVEYDVRTGEAIEIDHSLEGHALSLWPTNSTEAVVKWVYEESLGYYVGEVDNKRNQCLDHATKTMPEEAIKTIRQQLKEESNLDRAVEDRPETILEQDGIPDILVFDENEEEFYFLEVKAVGDNLRETQKNWMAEFDYLPVKIALSFSEKRLRNEFLNTSHDDYFEEVE